MIELIVTLGIFGIIFSIALPSMRDFVLDYRISSNVNEFLAANQLARSEAIKRGRPVSLCIAGTQEEDPDACCFHTKLTIDDMIACNAPEPGDLEYTKWPWESGWLVIADEHGKQKRILSRQSSLNKRTADDTPERMTVVTTEPYLVYSSTGRLVAQTCSPNPKFYFQCNKNHGRRVCFDKTGRSRVVLQTSAATPSCA
nr:GspH/FimT family pseudopilin [Glaciimonas immobilis]